MELFIEIILCIGSLLGLAYVILLLCYSYGWLKNNVEYLKNDKKIFVSVIVAMRNEENNAPQILTSLNTQNYPSEYFELIIVDDNSTDKTKTIIQEYLKGKNEKNSKLISLDENKKGKKNAITEAIKIANGELIVTTDADCSMNSKWLTTIVNFYKTKNPKMIVGPVCIQNSKKLFAKIQALEFNALQASTGGSLYFIKAIMCNGANLAYPKKIFIEVNGFENIDNTATGDDVLLMYKIKKVYPNEIMFLKNSDAIVFTTAKNSLNEFIQQRLRWGSKKISSLNNETIFTSSVVFFFNLFILVFPLFYFFGTPQIQEIILCSWITMLLSKAVADFLLVYLSSIFFNNKNLLFYFIPEFILYTPYVVLTVFIGFKRKYKWKARTYYE